MQPRKRIKLEPGTQNPDPVPDQKPGDVILIEDDEETQDANITEWRNQFNGKQHHYQPFMRQLVIFVNFEF